MSAAAGFVPLYRRRVAIAVKTPVALVGQALMPILWVLVVGPALARAGAGSTDPDVDYFAYVAIGQIVFILPFSAMFAGLTVLNDRNVGVLRELLVAPIRRATIPLASIAAVLTVAAGQIALIVVLSVIRGADFHLAVGPTLAALAAGGLLAGGIYALAEYLAYTLKQPQTFGTLIPAIGATPYLLCGALYPIATLPDGVRQFSWLLPWSHAVALLRDGFIGAELLPSRPDLAPALADRDGPPQPRGARGLRRPDGRARDARVSPRDARLATPGGLGLVRVGGRRGQRHIPHRGGAASRSHRQGPPVAMVTVKCCTRSRGLLLRGRRPAFAGLSEERLKGLEPSTFCMATKPQARRDPCSPCKSTSWLHFRTSVYGRGLARVAASCPNHFRTSCPQHRRSVRLTLRVAGGLVPARAHQRIRPPGCGPGGRGFESRRSPLKPCNLRYSDKRFICATSMTGLGSYSARARPRAKVALP